MATSPTRRDTNISTVVASDDHDAFYPTSPTSDSSEVNDAESVPPTHKHRTLILCFDGTGKILCCLSAHPLVIVSELTECWSPFFGLSGDQFDDDVSLHQFLAHPQAYRISS